MGRVAGPSCLGYVSDIDTRCPFALSAAAAAIAAIVLLCVRGAFSRGVAAFNFAPDIPPSGPSWADERFTEDDVQDVGRFLCQLLADNHYKWHSPEQRERLKKTLR